MKTDLRCSKRIEKQISDIQEKSENKKLEVCMSELWAKLHPDKVVQIFQLQTQMQQQQQQQPVQAAA